MSSAPIRGRRLAQSLALALLALGAPLAADTPTATLYSGATLIDGTGTPPRPDQDILVDGERIIATGPHGSLAVPAGANTVNLSGKWVMPGLIDSHVHLATPPNRVQAEAVLRRNLYGGVTAVRDMADDLRAVGELARAARAGEIASPDIYYAALMAGESFFDDPRTAAVSLGVERGKAPWMQAIGPQTDIRTAVTLARGTSATAIKVYANLPADKVRAITREAHRQHMLVWAHSVVFPDRPEAVIAAGVDAVSHICYLIYQQAPVMPATYKERVQFDQDSIGGDQDRISAGLFAEMLKRGTIIDATTVLAEKVEAEVAANPGRRPWRCSSETVARLTRQAWRAGVPISAGTDLDPTDTAPWPALYDELDFLVRRVGMPLLEVIKSATLVSARAAGQDKDMGTIAPGKLANFLVLAADPAQSLEALKTIETTVKRGRAWPRTDYRPVTREELGL